MFQLEDSADGIAKVVYTSKDGKSRKVFTALDWLARLTTHIPGRYEQMVKEFRFSKAGIDFFQFGLKAYYCGLYSKFVLF